MSWKDVKHEGISYIEKIVAEFDVWVHPSLPFAKVKVKIKENSKTGTFFGQVNVAVISVLDGTPDWIGGNDSTIEEALENAVKHFYLTLQGREGLSIDDFEWADPHDF